MEESTAAVALAARVAKVAAKVEGQEVVQVGPAETAGLAATKEAEAAQEAPAVKTAAAAAAATQVVAAAA